MFELINRKLSLKVSFTLALITLPTMAVAAYFVTAQEQGNLERLTIDTGKLSARSGAKMYGAALEAGIDRGLFSLADLIKPNYQEIKGYDFGDKPRFHTNYDDYTDRVTLGLEDKFLAASSDLIYAVGVDNNGYIPTHNSKALQPMIGDLVKDRKTYRSKRKFDNEVELPAARNLTPLLVQYYPRDTGERAWDVAAPIFVNGNHYGGFRVGVSVSSVTVRKHALLLELAAVFGVLFVITIGFIFVMLQRAMRPLEQITALANEISTGEGLDKPIKPATTDEVGEMARSLNRLRTSLQSAMARLRA